MKAARVNVLLSAQRALLGEVFPSLDRVDISWSNGPIVLKFFLSSPPTDDDRDSMTSTETEILADFDPEMTVSSEHIVGSTNNSERGESCIFARRPSHNYQSPRASDGMDLVCISESVYEENLTYGREYQASSHDGEKRQYRIKGDRGRKVWIPVYCFAASGTDVPMLKNLIIDDEITDPSNDIVEVTLTLSNESQRWCTFCTPGHLNGYLESNNYYQVPYTVLVPRLSQEAIEKTIDTLIRQGQLTEVTRPL